mmetsp:Transcript_11711/g.41013  ORF Transcript_11711/g.41013 Transcript_11711/m.41013 type:complete len:230 (+) Transcript_11711:601-1290(+)
MEAGQPVSGVVRRAAVHQQPVPGGRQEVRHAPLRARHLLLAARRLHVPLGLRALLAHAVLERGGRRGQQLCAPDERGHPEDGRQLRRRRGRQVGPAQPQAAPHLPHGHREDEPAVRGHRGHHPAVAARRAEDHDQRQALLRAVRLRHPLRRRPRAVAARGQRLALALRKHARGLRPEVQDAERRAGRGGHRAAHDRPRGAHRRLRPHLVQRAHPPRARLLLHHAPGLRL